MNDDPTHKELMERIGDVEEIARGNQRRLDELAGAARFGKWLLPILLTVGGMGVAVWQLFPNGK